MSNKVYTRLLYIADLGMRLRSSSASWHSVLPVPRRPLMATRVVCRMENLTLRLTYEITSLWRIVIILAKSVSTCLWNLSASGGIPTMCRENEGSEAAFLHLKHNAHV